MDEETRQLLTSAVDALESIWLENVAMAYLLDHYQAPDWLDSMHEYCKREKNQALVHAKFAPLRSLIQAVQADSKALESLLQTLGTKGKPN